MRGNPCSLMVRWVVGLTLHGGPIELCGMCYLVCGLMHIKEPLLLIGKSSPCGGSGFPLSLSGAMDRRIDHSWGGPIELFLVPAILYV